MDLCGSGYDGVGWGGREVACPTHGNEPSVCVRGRFVDS
jgi:hypothetical protein